MSVYFVCIVSKCVYAKYFNYSSVNLKFILLKVHKTLEFLCCMKKENSIELTSFQNEIDSWFIEKNNK